MSVATLLRIIAAVIGEIPIPQKCEPMAFQRIVDLLLEEAAKL